MDKGQQVMTTPPTSTSYCTPRAPHIVPSMGLTIPLPTVCRARDTNVDIPEIPKQSTIDPRPPQHRGGVRGTSSDRGSVDSDI
ncbi:hypothetical protein N7535_005694 [Penicillium sp. DV-2018c]|nr:hypothetical protein N7461_009269 [Penicillium sp. DV-2018c]KAJ5572034.1 hypothetical protein N7535_005694 [Penicillium sp. DV-2018c]